MEAEPLIDWTNAKPVDPIPASVKAHFFTGVKPPNYTDDYDAIGFDADLCMVHYKHKPFLSMLAQIELEDLHKEHGYPAEILDVDWSEDSTQLQVCLNYGVWDIARGNVLKLGENKEVLAAMKGWRVLTDDEIKAEYGVERLFETVVWPHTHVLPLRPGDTVDGKYWTFATFLDSCKIVQVAQGVHLIESGKLNKTYLELFQDIWDLVRRHYMHFDKDRNVLEARTYGSYFPKVFAEP